MDERTLYKAIFEANPNAIVVIDTTGQWVAFNEKARCLLGPGKSTPAETTDRHAYRFLKPDRLTPFPQDELPLVRALRGESVEDVEVFVTPPGRPGALLSVHARALCDSGTITGAFAIFSDITERYQKDEALRVSEARHREAQRVAHVGSWEWNRATDEVVWTDEIYRILGFDPQQPALNFAEQADLFSPATYAKLQAAVSNALATGEPYAMDVEVRRINGTMCWLSARGEVMRGPAGDIVGLRGTLKDITDRKERDLQNARLAEQLREAQRLAHVGSWEWDPERDKVTWSEEVYQIFGYDSRLPAPPFRQSAALYAEADYAKLKEAVDRALADGRPYELDLEFRRPDGTRGWLSSRGEVIRDGTGRITGLHGTALDITDRKESELRNAVLAKRLLMATRVGKIGVWELDCDTGMVEADELAHEIFGIPYAPDMTRSLEECYRSIHPDDRHTVAEALSRSIADGCPFAMDYRVYTPSGECRHVRGQAAVIEEPGKPRRLLGTDWDITELKTLTLALEAEKARLLTVIDQWIDAKDSADRANKAKSEFLATMSHELRTPMNAILGFGELMASEKLGPLNAKQRDFVESILNGGQHLLKLIEQILDLSQIESGRLTILLEPTSVTPIMKAVQATLRQIAKKYDVILFTGDLGSSLPLVDCDPVRLVQALINLGSNAIKYNRPGGAARFRYRVIDQNWVRITVTDTGIGIPKARQNELFQPFNRLGIDHLAIEGTGIGLAITHRLVELMGGRIGFVSKAGTGSSFWVDLPIHHAETAVGEAAA
jgi:PAS domain S-box-containing protein